MPTQTQKDGAVILKFVEFMRELLYDEDVPELLGSDTLDSNIDDAVGHGYEVGFATAKKNISNKVYGFLQHWGFSGGEKR